MIPVLFFTIITLLVSSIIYGLLLMRKGFKKAVDDGYTGNFHKYISNSMSKWSLLHK